MPCDLTFINVFVFVVYPIYLRPLPDVLPVDKRIEIIARKLNHFANTEQNICMITQFPPRSVCTIAWHVHDFHKIMWIYRLLWIIMVMYVWLEWGWNVGRTLPLNDRSCRLSWGFIHTYIHTSILVYIHTCIHLHTI